MRRASAASTTLVSVNCSQGNATAVTTVTATDPNAGQTLAYSIIGGADQALFRISATGVLSFVSGRDFEAPSDSDRNNSYIVQVRVADNGTGMPDEVLDKIFIPFFSTKKQGSGIGLSLCKQIVLLHRGSIQVQSVPGEGSAFVMQFG